MLTPPAILVDPYLKECYAAHAKLVDYDGNFEIFRTRTFFRFKVPIEVIIIDPFSLWWVQNEERSKLTESRRPQQIVNAVKTASDPKTRNVPFLLTLRTHGRGGAVLARVHTRLCVVLGRGIDFTNAPVVHTQVP
jgi:hypothetical protein